MRGLHITSHLALDWLTPAGVPLAWPLRRQRYAAPVTVCTGGLSEFAIAALLAGVLVMSI
jgi:inner membrane protein